MGRELLQVSLLSLIIFNIFIDSCPRTLRKKHPSFLSSGYRINSLLHADNTVLALLPPVSGMVSAIYVFAPRSAI